MVVTTEFGRTPRINEMAGRDHWPQAFSIVMAGGGIKTGQAIGATDKIGASVTDRPVTPPDMAATVLSTLGIDPATTLHTPLGRPVQLVSGGQRVRELFSGRASAMAMKAMSNLRIVALYTAAVMLAAVVPKASAQQVPIDPASTHIFPAGGQRGTKVPVRVGGQCLAPLTAIRFHGAGIQAPPVLGPHSTGNYEPSPRRDPRETPAAYPKEWTSAVEIAADADFGPHLWRLTSGRGGTGARPFVVGDLPEFIENESNSMPEKAELVTLPVTINGQIAGERDVDYFRFQAEAGDTIVAEVAAARLGSPLETVIEIYDAAGGRVKSQQLHAGGDPVLVFQPLGGGRVSIVCRQSEFSRWLGVRLSRHADEASVCHARAAGNGRRGAAARFGNPDRHRHRVLKSALRASSRRELQASIGCR